MKKVCNGFPRKKGSLHSIEIKGNFTDTEKKNKLKLLNDLEEKIIILGWHKLTSLTHSLRI